jgi:hypothetical protein
MQRYTTDAAIHVAGALACLACCIVPLVLLSAAGAPRPPPDLGLPTAVADVPTESLVDLLDSYETLELRSRVLGHNFDVVGAERRSVAVIEGTPLFEWGKRFTIRFSNDWRALRTARLDDRLFSSESYEFQAPSSSGGHEQQTTPRVAMERVSMFSRKQHPHHIFRGPDGAVIGSLEQLFGFWTHRFDLISYGGGGGGGVPAEEGVAGPERETMKGVESAGAEELTGGERARGARPSVAAAAAAADKWARAGAPANDAVLIPGRPAPALSSSQSLGTPLFLLRQRFDLMRTVYTDASARCS